MSQHELTSNQTSAKLKIFVVEDNPLVRTYHSQMLLSMGCQVTAAESAEEALELLLKERYDLIFTDVCLPKLNGIGLRKEIQDSFTNNRTPVVAITTSPEYRDSGFDEFYIKPVTADTFRGVLSRWTKGVSLQQETA